MPIALVARSVGAEVVVLELDSHRRAVAGGLGLRTLDPAHDDIPAFIDDWTGSAGTTVAFEVSGSAPGVNATVGADMVGGQARAFANTTSPGTPAPPADIGSTDISR